MQWPTPADFAKAEAEMRERQEFARLSVEHKRQIATNLLQEAKGHPSGSRQHTELTRSAQRISDSNPEKLDREMTQSVMQVRDLICEYLDHDNAERIRMIPICVLGWSEFNALLYPTSSGFYIVIDGGLYGHFRLMNDIFFAHCVPKSALGHAWDTSGTGTDRIVLSTEKAVRLGVDVCRAALKRKPSQPHLDFMIDRTAVQGTLSDHCTLGQEIFVLCHEFGHALGGHWLSSPTRKVKLSVRSGREIILVVSSPDWDQEFEADEIGCDLFFQVGQHLPPVCCCGMDASLLYGSLVELIGGYAKGSETHPPESDRRTRLLAKYGERIPQGATPFIDRLEWHVSNIANYWRRTNLAKDKEA